MQLRVVIVDDTDFIADEIEGAVLCYKSIFDNVGITYEVVKVCKGRFAFIEAKDFILKNQEIIDIIFADYDLIDGTGTDLFLLFSEKFRIYKVLHSIRNSSATKVFKKKLQNVVNTFYFSKDNDEVHVILNDYEVTILKIKLFGHPSYSTKKITSYINGSTLYEEARFGHVPLYAILYAQIISANGVRIVFRDKDGKIDETDKTGDRLPFFRVSGFDFVDLSRNVVVNLLWVANVNLIESKIKFITLESEILELPFELKHLIVSPLLSLSFSLPKKLPQFFR